MAQRVNVVLVDDIDGEDAAETVTFSLDGVNYEIDLSEDNAAGLRDALALYVGHARRTSGRRVSASAGRQAKRGVVAIETSAAEIRAWARSEGFAVPDRGRVSAEVREAFAAAH